MDMYIVGQTCKGASLKVENDRGRPIACYK